ncbi:MAG TPA: DUF202 domain-containing protein [Rhabdochlamydiaceae bacterium]|nr:DUF202 domain-containing protein [Rhabdochlamydiaceae bacterium]
MAKKPSPPTDRKDHRANERTFLAWIRTSIGIMAFGFCCGKICFFHKTNAYFLGAQAAELGPF